VTWSEAVLVTQSEAVLVTQAEAVLVTQAEAVLVTLAEAVLVTQAEAVVVTQAEAVLVTHTLNFKNCHIGPKYYIHNIQSMIICLLDYLEDHMLDQPEEEHLFIRMLLSSIPRSLNVTFSKHLVKKFFS